MILAAFYGASSARPPIGLAQVVGYVWLSQATLLLIPWRSDPEVREQVRTVGTRVLATERLGG